MSSAPRLLATGAVALFTLVGCGSTSSDSAAGGLTQSSPGGGGGSGGAGLSVMVSQSGSGGGGESCEREITLQAVQLGEPAPFDLVIVADHSMSLAWSRDELSKGLQDLLSRVQGRTVRVFLLTPTQYGASSATARHTLTGKPIVAWQDPVSGAAYQDAMTEYSQTCTDPQGTSIDCPDPQGKVPYNVHGTWNFVMPPPVATLAPNMSPADFAAQAEAVRSAILAIGGTGAPKEQPLCTLARYVSQPAASLPKNAVFLVISDEDDTSLPDECLVGHDSELRLSRREDGSQACSSSCDVYRYTMTGTRTWLRMPFTCAAFTDTGERIAGTDKSSWYNLDSTSCDKIDPGPCTDAERAKIQPFCDSGLTLAECSRECASSQVPCRVDLPSGGIDACTSSFSFEGKTYQNLAEYCAPRGMGFGACSGGGLKIQYTDSFSGGYAKHDLAPGTATDDIATYFKTTAAKAFAGGGYLLEGIVFDPSFSCTLGSGQSYATNLGRFIGDKTHLFPLCESYAPALEGVVGFAQTLIQTEFTLTLKADEHVSSVVIIAKDGSERKLGAAAYHFDPATQILKVDPASLGNADASLRVEVTSDCRPVVH
jgi:hypothetical protein